MHRPLNDDDSSSEEEEEEEEEDIRLCHFRGCISVAATGGEGLCDGHSRSICGNDERGRNKLARPLLCPRMKFIFAKFCLARPNFAKQNFAQI